LRIERQERRQTGMEMKITFPGGKKVYAEAGGMVIRTDQPVLHGGDGTGPSPYMLFLASIGTCAGIYVLGFCQERGIPTEGVSLTQRLEYATTPDGGSALDRIAIEIHVPPGFPEKYHKTLVRVADQCAVKKTIMAPPKFDVRTVVG
jgi:ribosomal protein S12 methylthiotransferase accessory factor